MQALAALELDDAYPAVVVCPASIKLNWERESHIWLPERRVTVLHGRTLGADDAEALRDSDVIVVNYEILDAHLDALSALKPRAAGVRRVALREAAARAADQGRAGARPLRGRGRAEARPDRHAGDEPPEGARVAAAAAGRLRDFGSGAELTRRFATHASHDRLHWNLRATATCGG